MKYLVVTSITVLAWLLPAAASSQTCKLGPAEVSPDTGTVFLPWSVNDIRHAMEEALREHDFEYERHSDDNGEVLEAIQRDWSDGPQSQMWHDHVHPGLKVRIQIRPLEDSTAVVLDAAALCAVAPEQNGHDHAPMEKVAAIVAKLELSNSLISYLQGRRRLRGATDGLSDLRPRVISCPALPRLEATGLHSAGQVVTFDFIVEPTGTVTPRSIAVVGTPDPTLEHLAFDALVSCRFRPARVDGANVAAAARMSFKFWR